MQESDQHNVNELITEMGELIGLAHRLISKQRGVEASGWRIRYAALRIRLLPTVPAGITTRYTPGYVDREFWHR